MASTDTKENIEEFSSESIDSGFISGPQISSEDYLEINNVSERCDGEIKKLNSLEPTNQKPEHSLSNIGSEEDCNLQKEEKEPLTNFLPKNDESGILESFSNLSLNNNTTSSASQQHYNLSETTIALETDTKPKKTTSAHAWIQMFQQDDDGDTSLHLACISGYVDVVAALIRMSPHPCLFNIKNDRAQTPLHLATLAVQPKIIRMLLIAGAEPTIRDRHGNTALHLACISGEEECVHALTMPINSSEVHEAYRQYGHCAYDKSYIKYAQPPSDLEIRNYDGERCVHVAAQAGSINILRILVSSGADINAKEGKSGRTPLHIAIECCNEDLVNYILDDCQYLNLETETYAGLTAYQVACMLNRFEIQNVLRKRGAELITPPDSGYESSDIDLDDDDSKAEL